MLAHQLHAYLIFNDDRLLVRQYPIGRPESPAWLAARAGPVESGRQVSRASQRYKSGQLTGRRPRTAITTKKSTHFRLGSVRRVVVVGQPAGRPAG